MEMLVRILIFLLKKLKRDVEVCFDNEMEFFLYATL